MINTKHVNSNFIPILNDYRANDDFTSVLLKTPYLKEAQNCDVKEKNRIDSINLQILKDKIHFLNYKITNKSNENIKIETPINFNYRNERTLEFYFGLINENLDSGKDYKNLIPIFNNFIENMNNANINNTPQFPQNNNTKHNEHRPIFEKSQIKPYYAIHLKNNTPQFPQNNNNQIYQQNNNTKHNKYRPIFEKSQIKPYYAIHLKNNNPTNQLQNINAIPVTSKPIFLNNQNNNTKHDERSSILERLKNPAVRQYYLQQIQNINPTNQLQDNNNPQILKLPYLNRKYENAENGKERILKNLEDIENEYRGNNPTLLSKISNLKNNIKNIYSNISGMNNNVKTLYLNNRNKIIDSINLEILKDKINIINNNIINNNIINNNISNTKIEIPNNPTERNIVIDETLKCIIELSNLGIKYNHHISNINKTILEINSQQNLETKKLHKISLENSLQAQQIDREREQIKKDNETQERFDEIQPMMKWTESIYIKDDSSNKTNNNFIKPKNNEYFNNNSNSNFSDQSTANNSVESINHKNN